MNRLVLGLITCVTVSAQSMTRADDGMHCDTRTDCLTGRQLLRLDCTELESIYKNGSMPGIPDGKLRGTVIVSPGSATNPAVSRASRLMWQGKVFDQQCGVATNRFFGVRLIKGQLAPGESWMDGKPSLILDYRGTSVMYANVRDEIRQVGPGLYLGAMYEERCCTRSFKMFFILEASCECK